MEPSLWMQHLVAHLKLAVVAWTLKVPVPYILKQDLVITAHADALALSAVFAKHDWQLSDTVWQLSDTYTLLHKIRKTIWQFLFPPDLSHISWTLHECQAIISHSADHRLTCFLSSFLGHQGWPDDLIQNGWWYVTGMSQYLEALWVLSWEHTSLVVFTSLSVWQDLDILKKMTVQSRSTLWQQMTWHHLISSHAAHNTIYPGYLYID